MSSYLERDSFSFANPFIVNGTEFISCLGIMFLYSTNKAIDYITNTLYPPVFDGTYSYITYVERTALFVGEAFLQCNNQYLNDAFGSDSHA